MKTIARSTGLALLLCSLLAQAAETNRPPQEVLNAAFIRVVQLFQPPAGAPLNTLTARVEVVRAEGVSKSLTGQSATLAFQGPDRIRASAKVEGKEFSLGRIGQNAWVFSSEKHFGINGQPGVARFMDVPESKDTNTLGALSLGLPPEQIMLLPLLMKVESKGLETIEGAVCDIIEVTPQPQAVEALKIPKATLRLWVQQSDNLPARIVYEDGKQAKVQIDLHGVRLVETWKDEQWQLKPAAGDKVETVALTHVSNLLRVAWDTLNQKIPTLGPATGERSVVATEGEGRLEKIDGTQVLFLKGTPEEMGHQHGVLLKKSVRALTDRVLYGVGVGSSFEKGRWFFGEIEEARKRLDPYMSERYYREMDALALAAGMEKQEVRLANFFPELFHCSGFALYGKATTDGHMYHGRILDYLKGIGLEQNAVVMVFQPDKGNAWVNIGYAGFVGSVTAMNAKHISIGEMGGRGEGQWDGKPMAELMREVMEGASTLDEAIAIMRKGPRTCEYYYVIADANSHRAVGIAATPTTFDVIEAGQSHPRLPRPLNDAVMLSAGDRYTALVDRVRDGYGKFTPESAREIMKRPVCMTSNIHSVLFQTDTLDFWVANADSSNVASHTRFTHYNLGELLKGPPAAKE